MKISKKSFLAFCNKSYAILLIIFLLCIFFWRVIFQAKLPFPGDFVTGIYPPWTDYSSVWGYPAGVPVKNPLTADVPSFIYPMQTFAVESLKSGNWGLWNPYILGGNPLMANFQSAPYSPLNIYYLFLDNINAWSLQVITGHFAAIIFTYILLRSWKLSKISSVLGGVIYGFSGFNLIWSQWNGHTLTAAFIPLALYFEQRFLRKPKYIFGLGLSIVLALQLLSGYPQVVFYTYIALFLMWASKLTWDKQYLLKTIFIGLFVFISIALTSFQNIPGKELLSLSQRDSEPLGYDIAFLQPENIIAFIAPDFYGNPATGNFWGKGDYTFNVGFVGIVALFLAFIGTKFNNQKKFTAILLIVSLILSLPTFVSIYIWTSGFLGLQAASAHRALVLFNLSISLLAAFGFESLMFRKSSHIKKAFILIGLFLGVFTFYAVLLTQVTAVRNLVLPWGIYIVLIILLLLINRFKKSVLVVIFLLCIFELFRFGWKFTPFSVKELVFPTTPELEYLMNQPGPVRITSDAIPINLRMAYKLESLEGYDAVYPQAMARFLAALSANSTSATPHNRYGQVDNLNSPLLDMSNVGFYLIKKDYKTKNTPIIFQQQKFEKVYDGPSTVIFKSRNAMPRAYVVSDWEVESDDTKVLDKMLETNFPIDKKIILDSDPKIEKHSDNKYLVSYINYYPNKSTISVYSQKPAMLFVSDVFYPGWKSKVNGVETEIYKANFVYRGIRIPAGNSIVEIYYAPKSFYIGIIISIISGFFLIMFLVIIGLWHYTLRRMTKAKAKNKTAEELHKNVPPDWYFKSMKRNLLQRWWHVSRFREVEKAIDQVQGTILDIGSADGVFTNVISKRSNAKQVIGIDVLPQSVKWANKHWKGTNMKFKVGNAHKLDFKTNSLDAVFALEVLEHVHEPINVLKEIKRVLKKDGYAVFLVPSDNDLFLLVWFLVKKFWWAKIWEDTHLQSYRNGKLTKLSKKAGFKVEKDKKFWLGMLHLIKVRKIK